MQAECYTRKECRGTDVGIMFWPTNVHRVRKFDGLELTASSALHLYACTKSAQTVESVQQNREPGLHLSCTFFETNRVVHRVPLLHSWNEWQNATLSELVQVNRTALPSLFAIFPHAL